MAFKKKWNSWVGSATLHIQCILALSAVIDCDVQCFSTNYSKECLLRLPEKRRKCGIHYTLVSVLSQMDKMEALLSVVFSKGHLEFREMDGGKHLWFVCPDTLSCSHIKVKAFCGEVYCFTSTLKMNVSITADWIHPLWVHCGFTATTGHWK